MDDPRSGIDFLLDRDDLQHPKSFKWTRYGPDVLPLWVADMDFATAESIRRALVDRATRGLGYEPEPQNINLTRLIRAKVEREGIDGLPEKGWMEYLPGVIPGLFLSVLALTESDQDVITLAPLYPPFKTAIEDQGRNMRPANLAFSDRGWEIDWEAMERAHTPATTLLMLCHPHNPTGRVWTRLELERIADFALRHHLTVVSDELHSDLTMDSTFHPFVSVSPPELRKRLVTLTGPCKTYNTAGLGIGAMISHNAELIARMKKAGAGLSPHPNAMSVAMWEAALQDDDAWRQSVLDYLRGNRQFIADRLKQDLPMVRYVPPQATYFAWLDFTAHPRGENVAEFLRAHAKVALADGHLFGQDFSTFTRLNFATSREILSEAMDRIVRALSA